MNRLAATFRKITAMLDKTLVRYANCPLHNCVWGGIMEANHLPVGGALIKGNANGCMELKPGRSYNELSFQEIYRRLAGRHDGHFLDSWLCTGCSGRRNGNSASCVRCGACIYPGRFGFSAGRRQHDGRCHRDEAHWITVALEAGEEDEKIRFLVDMSYELTNGRG